MINVVIMCNNDTLQKMNDQMSRSSRDLEIEGRITYYAVNLSSGTLLLHYCCYKFLYFLYLRVLFCLCLFVQYVIVRAEVLG